MEYIVDFINRLYPLTLSIVILLIYLWSILDKFEKYTSIKSFIGILIILSLIIHAVCFYINYETEEKIWVWALRDVGLIILSIILFENKILAIVNFLFWLGFGIYWALQLSIQEVYTEFSHQTTSETTESSPSAELLVILKDNDKLPALKNLIAQNNIQFSIKEAFPHLKDKNITDLDNCYIIDVANDEIANQVYEVLSTSNLVETIEWNDKYQAEPIQEAYGAPKTGIIFESINDEKAMEQWALKALEIDNLSKRLKKIKPKKLAKIFILDTGVDATHEDLKNNYFSVNSKYDKDTDKHGTHCAGIAASVTNNAKGIASLNYNNRFCRVTSITVLPGGRGYQETIVDGMIQAADLGADVISMSLGGLSNDKRQMVYEKAVEYCNQKGAIVVVAAGNSNQDAKYYAPACCKNVITVAAVNSNLDKAPFSNYFTVQKYGLCAPGVDILSTVPGDNYEKLNGTSMATPYVSSIVGIMKSIQPDLTTEEVYKLLSTTGMVLEDSKRIGNFIQPVDAIDLLRKKRSNYHWFIKWLLWFFTFKP